MRAGTWRKGGERWAELQELELRREAQDAWTGVSPDTGSPLAALELAFRAGDECDNGGQAPLGDYEWSMRKGRIPSLIGPPCATGAGRALWVNGFSGSSRNTSLEGWHPGSASVISSRLRAKIAIHAHPLRMGSPGDSGLEGGPDACLHARADPYRDLAVIDARAPRFNQATVGVVSLLGVVSGWWVLFALLALQLTLGLLLGRRWCLPCVFYFEVVQPRIGEGSLEDSRPPRFANQVGAVFLWAATASSLLGLSRVGLSLGAIVAALALLAATTGFCAGCVLYRIGARLRGVRTW